MMVVSTYTVARTSEPYPMDSQNGSSCAQPRSNYTAAEHRRPRRLDRERLAPGRAAGRRVLGTDNAWLAGGGSGHGYKLGPALGEHVAALVLGEAEPIAMFRPDREFAPEAGESQLKSESHPQRR